MDFDLESSSKRITAQRQQRQQDRAKALAAERAGRKIAEESDAKQQAYKERLRLARLQLEKREQEELLEADGVDFRVWLRPIPLTSAQSLETDRIRLPPSALANQSLQGAISKNIPLTFQISLYTSHDALEPIHATFAGVSEFTAEEGTVVVPLKTALSLVKKNSLEQVDLSTMICRVRYVPLPHHSHLVASLQPLGQGFHNQGQEQVSIDLKSVLSRVLSAQAALSEGDIVPIRHQGQTYYLRVKKLEPDSRALLLNTEVEIDLLPSEETEAEMIKIKEKQLLKEKRKQEREQILQQLPAEPTTSTVDGQVVTIRARLPAGGQVISRRFLRSITFNVVIHWVWASIPIINEDDNDIGPNRIELVQTYGPGIPQHVLTLEEFGQQTLIDCGWKSQKVETVNVRIKVHPSVSSSENKVAVPMEDVVVSSNSTILPSKSPLVGPWQAAVTESTLALDEVIQTTTTPTITTTTTSRDEDMATNTNNDNSTGRKSPAEELKFLLSQGIELGIAKEICLHANYLSTLDTLRQMNFLDTPLAVRRASTLIVEFHGGLARIVDKLTAMSSSNTTDNEFSLNHNQVRCAGCAKKYVGNISSLSQCGGCGKFYYCNAICAGVHWNGGHREECSSSSKGSNNTGTTTTSATTRDWSRELQILRDMGISIVDTNTNQVVQSLVKYNGDLNAVVVDLMAGYYSG
jgi:hypothetical protein